MTGFLVIGAVGLAVVLASLILGDIFEGLFDAFDVDFGSGLFSAPVIGSFLAAFGFGAALIMTGTGIGAAGGALGGLASGVVIGALALMMTRALIDMPTDPPVRTADVVGATAVVVTRIPDDGFGEITLIHSGQVKKLSARAAEPVPAGRTVVVTQVTSSSSVIVRPVEP
ncbi:MAG TPA: hypothetical protein VM324_17110 [Egibacteraceae bacterium]|nr:hypothetical protein [Egibacteraceae bacterium]